MIPVHYIGSILDTSGYAAAGRAYINALAQHGKIDLSVQVVSFEQQKTTHGPVDKLIEQLQQKGNAAKIQIIHLTPENYPVHRKRSKYNIAYTVWETDRLPPKWVDLCNSMNEIWVPSVWNIEVFKSSGVSVPIIHIPHVIDIPDCNSIAPLSIGEPDTFVFYSIFQWLERKNPAALLKAYLTEFTLDDNVHLALKTYRLNTSPQEQEAIKREIAHIKSLLRLDSYPPIVFFGNLMPQEHIQALHLRGDCYVSPHRAEGFAITIAEAMSHNKPVIATNYSGNLDFTTEKNSFLIDSNLTPVYGMIFRNYYGYMNWGDPSIQHLKELMRYVYQNRDEAKKRAAAGYETIQSKFNSQKIGQLMVDRLEQINQGLSRT